MTLTSVVASVALSATFAPADISDLWAGRARFQIDDRSIGAELGMHFISTSWFNGYLHAYYIDRNGGVGLARSSDGRRFQFVASVVPKGRTGAWDSAFATFPGYALLTTNRNAVVYEGKGTDGNRWPGDIGLAVGPTFQDFTKDANPILIHAKSTGRDGSLNLSWERNNIGTPSIIVVGSERFLFYHGFGTSWERGSPDDVQMGLATGTDLRNLKREATGPILRTGPAGSWDSGQTGRRSIMKGKDNRWYMAYEGSTDARRSADGRSYTFDWAVYSSGIARSSNLRSWTKFSQNPVLPRTNPVEFDKSRQGYGYDGPEFVKFPDGKLFLYFRAPNGATKRAELVWR
ncbi:MAG: hypothetical protein JNM34_04400 [Chthonomonadaceae bacterium]|nr:hypothetical protein [Chthonomonadaceae bacterium]